MSGISIDRLQGRQNYATWKIAVRALLELDNLWDTIEYKVKEDGVTPVNTIDADKDKKAKSKIILTMDPVCFVHIQSATTARQVWCRLAEAFEDNGLTRRIGLLRKLISTKLESCNSMEIYVNEIITTATALSSTGFIINEEWIAAFLLAGLPDEYRPMIMAMENSGLKLTGDAVKTKLLQEMRTPDDQALAAKGKGPRCRLCNEFGHIARFCPKNQKNVKSNKRHWKNKNEALTAVLSATKKCEDSKWYFDSGATAHMVNNESLLETKKPATGSVMAADGQQMLIQAVGGAKLYPQCRRGEAIPVKDVQFVPGLSTNLLSISQIVKKGHSVQFNNKGCEVHDEKGNVLVTGSLRGDLFELDESSQHKSFASKQISSTDLWHRRMGHLNIQSLMKLKEGCATGISFQGERPNDCKICPMGKQARLKFSKSGSRATKLLEVVHSDICSSETESIGGSRYFITFIDDYSRRIFIYFLKTKSEWEVTKTFMDFKTQAEKQTGHKVKTLRTDNGMEYMNKKFQDMLLKEGIRHQKSNVHTPQQNGLAERNNRTIEERARCMMFEANLPKTYWAEAANYAVYLINRSPSQGTGKTPEEMWSGKIPDLSHIRIFGTRVMAHVPKANRRKWDPKAVECIMTGYDEYTKGYRLYNPEKRQHLKSRDVTFLDEGKPRSGLPAEIKSVNLNDLEASLEGADGVQEENVDVPSPPSCTVTPISNALPQQQNSNPPQAPVLRRSERERKLPGKFKDFEMDKTFFPNQALPLTGNDQAEDITEGGEEDVEPATEEESVDTSCIVSLVAPPTQTIRPVTNEDVIESRPGGKGRPIQGKYPICFEIKNKNTRESTSQVMNDPLTVKEALTRHDSAAWKLAMSTEYEALMENKTWVLVDLPPGKKPIKTKWVFRTKRGVTGEIESYKARLVGKGYAQRKGVEYEETYAPVIRHGSLRFIFALAAQHQLIIEQMDAVSAFLQGELNEELYICQPEGFEDCSQPQKVCRLIKAIYGLKQSSRVWNEKLDAALKSFGLKRCDYDPCVYFCRKYDEIIIVTAHVDDLLIFGSNQQLIDSMKKRLSSTFRMKELGKVSQYLGIRVTQTENSISLDQSHYINEILERFGMVDAKPMPTPMNVSEKLTNDLSPKDDNEKAEMAQIPYREAVGCLNYIAQSTRPDIVFAVNQLSRFNNNPGRKHWQAVKHLLRYLKGTAHHGLKYEKSKSNLIIGYCDADWGANSEGRKSISGFVFTANGAAISWASRRQPSVSLSSCEAEFYALSNAVQEAIWWRGLKSQIIADEPIEIFCDNQSTIAIVKSGGFHAKAKHIDIRYNFTSNAVRDNKVKLSYTSSQNQTADILTKPLDKVKIKIFAEALGITPI